MKCRDPSDGGAEGRGKLEGQLTSWMREHLEVAVYPFANRDVLKSLEDAVIAVLDPPLNLDGMPPTPLRARLSELRSKLGVSAAGPASP